MKITINKITPRTHEVIIEHDGTRINLGRFDREDRAELARVLRDAADELWEDPTP